MNKWGMLALLSVTLVVGSVGYTLWTGNEKAVAVMSGEQKQDEKGAYREFVLEAGETPWTIQKGLDALAWTYNGTVPGPQIRVKEGERVKVILKNKLLPDPVTIHWHGYPVPNAMDGVAGVTQNGVRPGEEFVYDFVASVPGTYWYHSHQDGVNQVDRGLYGTFIVEPKDEKVKYDKDFTLVIDEWAPDLIGEDGHVGSGHAHGGQGQGGQSNGSKTPASSMPTMDMSKMTPEDHAKMMANMSPEEHAKMMAAMNMSHDQMMRLLYKLVTVNGKGGESIEPLVVRKGDRVKLRFINAGMFKHNVHLQGQACKVTHTDGQEIPEGPEFTDRAITVGPAERYDVEFVADGRKFSIDLHDDTEGSKEFKIPIVYEDDLTPVDHEGLNKQGLTLLDITKYSSAKPLRSPASLKFDLEQTFELGSKKVMKDGVEQEVYTMNGKVFPDTDPIHVRKGQRVKLRFTNPDTNDHPIHLHGHFFQVLSKNGKLLDGPPLMKDTIMIKPQEEYEIGFEANNDGEWMVHCHNLHHAASGMMTHVFYEGYEHHHFTPDPTVGNKPE